MLDKLIDNIDKILIIVLELACCVLVLCGIFIIVLHIIKFFQVYG